MTTTSASPVQGGARSCRIAQKQRTPSEGTDSGNSRETWISTNKILNSSLCGRRTNSRNPNFDYDETKLLISLWGDPQVQKTLITTHKKHPVIAELARKMREQGYSRSTEEINTRIKNLKCFYNRIKKDMAAGIINQTTWRHYAEMDEIISRPVFGNAHRVHLIQQQKSQGQGQQQQQEQRAGGARGRKAMTSDEGEEDDEDMPLDQFPVKLEIMSDDDDEATEIRAEDLLTIDAKFPEDNVSGSGGATAGNEFNDGLDELLLKAQTKGTPGPAAKPTFTISSAATTSKPANSSGLVIEKISSANGTTITATSSASSSAPVAPTAGKISVVPTNLLMKQPTVSTNLATPIQIYTQPTVSLAPTSMMGTVGVTKVTTAGKPGQTGVVTATPGSTGVTPMKLLLVNTVAKDGTTKQILTPASEVPTMSQLLPAPNYHAAKIPLALPGKSPIVSIPAVNVHAKVADTSKVTANGTGARKTGQSAGFKSLLTQLVTIQRENLTINQERLALEKERLEFEKQFGGSFVNMVRNMSSFFSGMLQHQRKDLKANNEPAQPAEPQALMKKPENESNKPEDDDHSSMAAKEPTPIESNGSASSSPTPVSDPLETVATSKKRPSSENDTVEEKDTTDKTPPNEPESSSSPVPSTNQTIDSSQNSSSSDVPLPKKRRMMTRNSTQLSQVPPPRISTPDEALKTEVISDNDER
ncbi:AGAP012178-PA-like protein [Anopheles sinensis]|uniref:AGAP012178-PA-like protein n=1 Tax=Anopheles sinensis TaxID=74873 RepID=A0A084WUK5_ANOSI|nr:AGAP012178-PA-like protein [Anopheles sinensis]